MYANNLDEVLIHLDTIIDDSLRRGSRLGLFAALYRHVTARVKLHIERGDFTDPALVDRFDTVFADRYLAAYAAHASGRPCTRSWAVAFAAAEDDSLICLQHLLLGMNAHINLDLALATLAVSPRLDQPGLRADFERINDILTDLLGAVQDAINRVSPLLHILDIIGGDVDEHLASFSLVRARRHAWHTAELLAQLPEPARLPLVELVDQKTAALGRLLIRPDPPRLSALALIRRHEPDDPALLIHAVRRAA